MTRDQFQEQFQRLVSIFIHREERVPSRAAINEWYAIFERTILEDFTAAVTEHIRTGHGFPDPSDLLEMVQKRRRDRWQMRHQLPREDTKERRRREAEGRSRDLEAGITEDLHRVDFGSALKGGSHA